MRVQNNTSGVQKKQNKAKTNKNFNNTATERLSQHKK